VKSAIQSILDRFLDDNTPSGQVEAEKLQNDALTTLTSAAAAAP
jgi:hypothetical protein